MPAPLVREDTVGEDVGTGRRPADRCGGPENAALRRKVRERGKEREILR
ncbi:hypothetical protein [Streptomyces wuyuanensis]|nr:hypothetical protein [Streptomyces wuyuanensis]